MRNAKGAILSAGNMASATLTSTSISCEHAEVIGIHVVCTGSPNGTFTVQESCDAGVLDDGSDLTTWTTVATQAITASGDILWRYPAPVGTWLRVVYTKSSGTGSCTIRFSRKGGT